MKYLLACLMFAFSVMSFAIRAPEGEHAVITCFNTEKRFQVDVLHDNQKENYTALAIVSSRGREVYVAQLKRASRSGQADVYTAPYLGGYLLLQVFQNDGPNRGQGLLISQVFGRTTKTKMSCTPVMY